MISRKLWKLRLILQKQGFKIIASDHTCSLLKENGIEAEKINKLQEGRPNMLDVITNGKVDMIREYTVRKRK